MKSKCTSRFWKLHDALPEHVRLRARKSYNLWKRDHHYPSLDFKKLKGGASNRFSIRIGDHHRAIGQLMGDVIQRRLLPNTFDVSASRMRINYLSRRSRGARGSALN